MPIALGESMIGDHAVLQYSAASSFSRMLKFYAFYPVINVNAGSMIPQGGVCK